MNDFKRTESQLLSAWNRIKADKFARNLGSLGLAQILVRVSRLVTTIVLSRLLLPEVYATAAVVLTVYEIIALFTRNGISAKVVQAAPNEVEVVAMTAWRMTWIVCVGLLVLQCLLAVPIASFYKNPALAAPIIAMATIYLATPLSNIQAAFQQREGHLGRMAFATALQVIVDNILTACFALLGYGFWAIILPKLLVAPIWLFLVRFGHPWRPKKIEGIDWFHGWKEIAKFSRSVLGTEILSTVQGNIDNLFVGYFLGLHALGIYYFAYNAGLGITLGFITAVGVAVFPYFCEVSERRNDLAKRFYQARNKICLSLVGLILTQAALAPIYVPIVFGPKWVEASSILSIICLSALARPFASVTSQLLKAVGKPEIELHWQIGNTAALVVALLISSQFNITAVALSVLVVQTAILGTFSVLVPRQLFSKRGMDQIRLATASELKSNKFRTAPEA